MKNYKELEKILFSIDRKSYSAYKSLKEEYEFLNQPIQKIAENIGYMTFGTLSTCLVVFLYCFIVKKKLNLEKTLNILHTPQEIRKSIIEAIIFGIFLSIDLGIGYFLNLRK